MHTQPETMWKSVQSDLGDERCWENTAQLQLSGVGVTEPLHRSRSEESARLPADTLFSRFEESKPSSLTFKTSYLEATWTAMTSSTEFPDQKKCLNAFLRCTQNHSSFQNVINLVSTCLLPHRLAVKTSLMLPPSSPHSTLSLHSADCHPSLPIASAPTDANNTEKNMVPNNIPTNFSSSSSLNKAVCRPRIQHLYGARCY